MLAIELIADIIPPAHTSDSIQKVVDRMIEFRIRHLPIVNEEQFLGLLSEDDLVGEGLHEGVPTGLGGHVLRGRRRSRARVHVGRH